MKQPSPVVVGYFFRRHRAVYAALSGVLLCAAALEALSVGSLFPLMTSILGGESVGGGHVLSVLQAASQIMPGNNRIFAAVTLLISLVTMKSLAVVLRDYLIAKGGATIVHEVKRDLFNRLARAPYQYFLANQQGDLSYRLTSAPQNLGLMLLLIPSAAAQALIVLAICLLLATISWQLTAVIIVLGAALYGLLRQVAKRISHVVGKQRTAALTREMGVVIEFLSGVKEILAAWATNRWARLYECESEELRRIHIRDSIWQSIPGVFIEWAFFVLIGVLTVVSQSISGKSLAGTIPMMAVYAYALYRLIRAVSVLSQHKLRLSGQLADAELLYYALHEPFPTLRKGAAVNVRFADSIRFDGVSFLYPGRTEFALKQVSLNIPKGSVTALVGHSGAGKTTLVNLLLKFYDAREGVIRVDGRDLGDYRQDAWLKLVGYVSQEGFILNGTIEENIRFGLTEGSDTDVEAAARAAHAHEFIDDLPQRYATVVGDRGMTLSGGQRQRIAIARVLLRQPEILIFDEATSALDGVSEALIQKAISELAQVHTLILVAHRLSTVRFAHQIVVLEGGRVIETGTHEELLAIKGQYSHMVAAAE